MACFLVSTQTHENESRGTSSHGDLVSRNTGPASDKRDAKTGKAVFLGLNMECVTAVKAALDLVILAVA